jgi:uncharacterized protein YdeI (YjbR/CyaY-like superfamily)
VVGASSGVPETASAHPTTWTFDHPIYHPLDRAAWRAWLEVNHGSLRGVWVATWRRPSGLDGLPYVEVVEEALCFGWIDSTVNVLDEDRRLQLMTPRRPRSPWTRLNRRRVADLEARGLMTDAGRRAVEVARANGWWTIYDPVEDLLEPDELAAALDGSPAARAAWDEFPPSARKQMLWWVVGAARPDTRAKRIATIVTEAEHGRRARG